MKRTTKSCRWSSIRPVISYLIWKLFNVFAALWSVIIHESIVNSWTAKNRKIIQIQFIADRNNRSALSKLEREKSKWLEKKSTGSMFELWLERCTIFSLNLGNRCNLMCEAIFMKSKCQIVLVDSAKWTKNLDFLPLFLNSFKLLKCVI